MRPLDYREKPHLKRGRPKASVLFAASAADQFDPRARIHYPIERTLEDDPAKAEFIDEYLERWRKQRAAERG